MGHRFRSNIISIFDAGEFDVVLSCTLLSVNFDIRGGLFLILC